MYPAPGAGFRIDVACDEAVLLDDGKVRRVGEFCLADLQALDQAGVGSPQQVPEMRLILRQRHPCRIRQGIAVRTRLSQTKIRLVVREEIGDRIQVLLRRRWIEHRHKHAHERVLFYDHVRHRSLRLQKSFQAVDELV